MFAALALVVRQAGWWQMRVLGVDPGLTRCGIGAVDGAPGRQLRLAGTGVIRTPAGDDIGARLLALETELEEWLTRLQPDAVAVERVFSQHNVRTVMGTAQAGAVAIVCAARHGIPVALYTPSEVKAAVTGTGTAGKQQVAAMVSRLLRLTDPPRPADCADALALAICHLWRGTAQRRLAAAVEAAAGVGGSSAQAGTAGSLGGSSPRTSTARVLGGLSPRASTAGRVGVSFPGASTAGGAR